MNLYLMFFLLLVGVGALIMMIIYLRYRSGLTSKMFALIIPTDIIIAELAFILGGEGAPTNLMVTLVPFGVVVVIVAMFAIQRIAIQPLTPMTKLMTHIANNRDLSTLPPVSKRNDEIRHIQEAFRTVAVNLREAIGRLQDGIGGVATTASEISATAQQAVATASEQSSVVAEVSATVEEIRQTSEATSESAREVTHVSDDALEGGRRGMHSVEEAVKVMTAISDQVGSVTDKMQQLNDKNDKIGAIITTVNELAEQSNLLAVNASIEAARAGEHGRGFSVVATEVRSLAEQSKASTKQVQSILNDIRRATEALLRAAEESQQRAVNGEHAIEAVRDAITGLLAVLEQSSSTARRISGASAQQAAGINQIAEAMDHVARGGRDTQSSAEQLEQAVADLSAIGKQLKGLADEYRV